MNGAELTYIVNTTLRIRERMEFMIGAIIVLVILLIVGIGLFVFGSWEDSFGFRLAGGIIFLFAILFWLPSIPSGNYTEWETIEENMLIQLDDSSYVIDLGEEYLYKASTFSQTGENVEEFRTIPKDENIDIEYVEVEDSEDSKCVVFSRKQKSIFGFELEEYKKYVFCIPIKS